MGGSTYAPYGGKSAQPHPVPQCCRSSGGAGAKVRRRAGRCGGLRRRLNRLSRHRHQPHQILARRRRRHQHHVPSGRMIFTCPSVTRWRSDRQRVLTELDPHHEAPRTLRTDGCAAQPNSSQAQSIFPACSTIRSSGGRPGRRGRPRTQRVARVGVAGRRCELLVLAEKTLVDPWVATWRRAGGAARDTPARHIRSGARPRARTHYRRAAETGAPRRGSAARRAGRTGRGPRGWPGGRTACRGACQQLCSRASPRCRRSSRSSAPRLTKRRRCRTGASYIA